MAILLLHIGAALPALWGIAHLLPTASVVRGFGPLSTDNRRILTMEWILEGVALIWIGAVVASVTFTDATGAVSRAVYAVCAAGLIVFAVVSLFTGFRVRLLPFRLCPVVFTTSAALVVLGGLVL